MPFDGRTYDSSVDKGRLVRQLAKVKRLMLDGEWRTLDEIATEVDSPPASVSARLRDLRKEKFGGYTVDRRRKGPTRGLFEYRVSIGS